MGESAAAWVPVALWGRSRTNHQGSEGRTGASGGKLSLGCMIQEDRTDGADNPAILHRALKWHINLVDATGFCNVLCSQ